MYIYCRINLNDAFQHVLEMFFITFEKFSHRFDGL